MNNNAAQIIANLRAEMPDGNCSLRLKGRDVISEAWTSGLEVARVTTDEGQVDTVVGAVRLATTALTVGDDTFTITQGEAIEILLPGAAEFQDARVGDRHESGGAIRLQLTAEFE